MLLKEVCLLEELVAQKMLREHVFGCQVGLVLGLMVQPLHLMEEVSLLRNYR